MNPNGLKLINFNMIWRNSCKIIDYHSIQKVSFVIKFLSISLEKHVFSPIMTKHAEAHWSHCIRRLNCSGEFRKHFCSPLFTELEHCAGGASSKNFRDYAPAILYSSAPSKQIYVPMFKKKTSSKMHSLNRYLSLSFPSLRLFRTASLFRPLEYICKYICKIVVSLHFM